MAHNHLKHTIRGPDPRGNDLSDFMRSDEYRKAKLAREMTHQPFQPPEDLEAAKAVVDMLAQEASGPYGVYRSGEDMVESLGKGDYGWAALAGLGMLPGIPAVTAWHGTPHKFAPTEKNALGEFDASKIGTGEGAQAYGHGLYFAENPEVAAHYADPHGVTRWVTYKGEKQNLPWTPGVSLKPEEQALHQVESSGGVEAALSYLRDRSATAKRAADRVFWQRSAEWLAGEAPHIGLTTPQLYKVDLPDEHVNNMLDWDKPLGEQPEHVRNALMKAGIPEASIAKAGGFAIRTTPSGKQFVVESSNGELGRYRSLEEAKARQQQLERSYSTSGKLAYQKLGGNPEYSRDGGYGDAEASRKLREAGIPGIRYLDAGSRGAGQGTSNYVVFDPSITRILARE